MTKSGTAVPWEYYAGTAEVIAARALRPRWNKVDAKFGVYDVDHRKDVQLSGDDEDLTKMLSPGGIGLMRLTRELELDRGHRGPTDD